MIRSMVIVDKISTCILSNCLPFSFHFVHFECYLKNFHKNWWNLKKSYLLRRAVHFSWFILPWIICVAGELFHNITDWARIAKHVIMFNTSVFLFVNLVITLSCCIPPISTSNQWSSIHRTISIAPNQCWMSIEWCSKVKSTREEKLEQSCISSYCLLKCALLCWREIRRVSRMRWI